MASSALAVAAAVLVPAGCDEENTAPEPVVQSPTSLHYDAANLSAPNLAAGAYEAGARFTSTQIGDRVGKKLIEVRYYIDTPAEACSVKVYGAGTAAEPGALLYAADVTNDVQSSRWNIHTLSQPVTLTGADLWICLQFTNAVGQPTLGCDPGPAVPDGDWLYTASDGVWMPLHQRFAVSINWNIRGTVGSN